MAEKVSWIHYATIPAPANGIVLTQAKTITLRPPFASRAIPPNHSPTLLSASSSSLANDDGPQPVLDSVSTLLLTPIESLPTIFGRGNKCFWADDEIPKFLAEDLNLNRLNRIHDHLWMAGRPLRARPLHRYQMMGFDVLYTQQMDLHLLKFSNKLMLKPLPEWMLSYEFWHKYICDQQDLHESACGFLVSYVWLITTPLDLKIAHDKFLVPSFVTWHWWKEFVKDVYGHIDMESLDGVNKRYHFGDLRLGRINSIYRSRFFFTHFVRGYLYGYNRYVVFFQRKFSWILIVFVFFSLVLSAMQVGASVPPLQSNDTFLRVSYGFVVFSIVSCAAVLGMVSLIFVGIFFFNMAAAISHDKRMRIERDQRAKERHRIE